MPLGVKQSSRAAGIPPPPAPKPQNGGKGPPCGSERTRPAQPILPTPHCRKRKGKDKKTQRGGMMGPPGTFLEEIWNWGGGVDHRAWFWLIKMNLQEHLLGWNGPLQGCLASPTWRWGGEPYTWIILKAQIIFQWLTGLRMGVMKKNWIIALAELQQISLLGLMPCLEKSHFLLLLLCQKQESKPFQ